MRRAPRPLAASVAVSSVASSASRAGAAIDASSCRNAISTGVRSRSNTRSSSMPLPTGAFSRKRVPTASPTNGSNTSADVNGRIVRVNESREAACRGRLAVQVELQTRNAARAVIGQREVRPFADGHRVFGLDGEHVRGRRVRERHPELAVIDRQPIAGAARVLLGEMIEDRHVLVVRADVEPEVERERLGCGRSSRRRAP